MDQGRDHQTDVVSKCTKSRANNDARDATQQDVDRDNKEQRRERTPLPHTAGSLKAKSDTRAHADTLCVISIQLAEGEKSSRGGPTDSKTVHM